MNASVIIQETVNLILKDYQEQIDAILLFGSHADGTNIWRSDIDICVVFKRDFDSKEATLFRIKIAGQVSDKIDIQVFNTLPLKTCISILSETCPAIFILNKVASFESKSLLNTTQISISDRQMFVPSAWDPNKR